MSEQSDTPRTDAEIKRTATKSMTAAFQGMAKLAETLERELAAASKQKDNPQ